MSWLNLRRLAAATVAVLSIVFFLRHSERVRLANRLADDRTADSTEVKDNCASSFSGSQGRPGAPSWKSAKGPVAKAHAAHIETDERDRGHADLAALLGAVAVILLTLTLQPGAWGYISTIVGSTLLCVLIAFFARHPSTTAHAGGKWESFVVAVALAALVGIVGAVTGAWPVQDNLFRDSPYCRAVGVNAATSAVRDLSETGLHSFGATPQELSSLIQSQLSSPTPVDDDTTLGHAFYRAYSAASGDCLSGDTTDHLWIIALPLFGVTLSWWIASFWRARKKKAPANRNGE